MFNTCYIITLLTAVLVLVGWIGLHSLLSTLDCELPKYELGGPHMVVAEKLYKIPLLQNSQSTVCPSTAYELTLQVSSSDEVLARTDKTFFLSQPGDNIMVFGSERGVFDLKLDVCKRDGSNECSSGGTTQVTIVKADNQILKRLGGPREGWRMIEAGYTLTEIRYHQDKQGYVNALQFGFESPHN